MVITYFFIGRNNKYGGVYKLSFKEIHEFLTLSPKKTIFSIRTEEVCTPSALCPEAVVSSPSKVGHSEGLISCQHFSSAFSSSVLSYTRSHAGSLSSTWPPIFIKIVVIRHL